MITASNFSAETVQLRKSVLLMDTNPERRALRKKIMALHNVDLISASDLDEAALIWHRDRYDLVLIDIRRDHRGALALRDEIKKESPKQNCRVLGGQSGLCCPESDPGLLCSGRDWDGMGRLIAQGRARELRISVTEEQLRGGQLADCRRQGARSTARAAIRAGTGRSSRREARLKVDS